MSKTSSHATSVIDGVDIAEEISKFVKLKPSKNELLGLCPFHTEDTPSFYVNPQKRLFYCFGCQAGGNVINFRAKIQGLSNADAIEALGKDYNIKLSGSFIDHQSHYQVLETALHLYQNTLKQSIEAQNYLQSRDLTAGSIQAFKIGYAPNGWQNLAGLKQINSKHAKELGLIIDNAKGGYDRFRHRIMFPIYTHHGSLVGFGGRSLGDEKPKYINSSESALYNKSRILFGLNQALQNQQKQLILVEGYMDVISLHQAGFTGAVASLGTAFTASHFQLAAKYAESIVFCFDGDEAGQKAADKTFHTILPLVRDQISCYFLTMPRGEDPDSFIKNNGIEAFRAKLTAARPFSTHLLEHYPLSSNPSLEEKAQQYDHLQKLLNHMPNSILKRLIIEQIPQLSNNHKPIRASKSSEKPNHNMRFIELAFSYPELIISQKDSLKQYLAILPSTVQLAIQRVLSNPQTSLAGFLTEENISFTQNTHAVNQAHDMTEQMALHEISGLLTHYQMIAVEQKIQEHMAMIEQNINAKESSEILQKLLIVKHGLIKKKSLLAKSEDL
ncbi:DNA primase [Candidatus Synchoanobacter obligatus]|uniref:DNA primase n=1 Tax=Candidatus Synchoanobacter obligatus TaxID=2919597 RepID=A0ABT1L3F0_9GAMM|nr:DNA primase [Candidatus Synchoanobacter obligatus]MCP8351747.1 DNA primase [Candidatus Synchoanobacter obligatus]